MSGLLSNNSNIWGLEHRTHSCVAKTRSLPTLHILQQSTAGYSQPALVLTVLGQAYRYQAADLGGTVYQIPRLLAAHISDVNIDFTRKKKVEHTTKNNPKGKHRVRGHHR